MAELVYPDVRFHDSFLEVLAEFGNVRMDALPFARKLGIERALLTCDEDHVGSRRVIERNGRDL